MVRKIFLLINFYKCLALFFMPMTFEHVTDASTFKIHFVFKLK